MADFFEWMDSYSVGVEQIDEDHKRLVGLVNRMVHVVHEHKGDGAARQILTELMDYTVYHFNHEESLMASTGYPEFEQHRAQHNRLVRNLVGFFGGERLQAIDPVQVETFMIEWLLQHILKEDARFAAHFRRQGIR